MMMGTLTVRENINFSAMLRLPQATSEEERQRAVDIILSDLGIAHVSNSRVKQTVVQNFLTCIT